MFSVIVEKELKSIIMSPKFAATFGVCSILLLLSVFVGINEYNNVVAQYETINKMTEEEMRQQSAWHGVYNRVAREPDPMQIFVSGVSYDIGRKTIISNWEPVDLEYSSYSDDPIFALFRFIDFGFIVQVVLSLFAILFTFDSINGERERGTLQLVFSNAIPRATYILGKCVGSWLGLVIPILIPILISFLLIVIFNVPFTPSHWTRLIGVVGVSVLFFTFFITLGVLISAATKRSSVSFMASLVAWILLVLIIPKLGVLASSQIVPVPQAAEIEGRIDAFSKDAWNTHWEEMEDIWQERNANRGDVEGIEDDDLWAYMEEDDERRSAVEASIEKYRADVEDDLRKRRYGQRKLAFLLSRFSPVSSYQLAVMDLAGTDIDLKPRNVDAMREFRTDFNDAIKKKQQEDGQTGGIMISITDEGGFELQDRRDKTTLDLSDLPRFAPPRVKTGEAVNAALVDSGLLMVLTLGVFAAAFVAFVRYDVR